MTLVKICGIKTLEHGRTALEAGADFLGFIFYPGSDRYVAPDRVREIVTACRASHGGPDRWQAVGVFVDEPLDRANAVLNWAGLDLAQLCGRRDGEPGYVDALHRPAVRVVHVGREGRVPAVPPAAECGAQRLLLDASVPGYYGGTGQSYPWDAVRPIAGQAFLAGGLTPANVGMAISAAAPWGVDVSSGVEQRRVKNPDLIRQFVREVRRADQGPA